jgi:uncharacterized membrane protein YgdD (TMEM256/DUF423 family)
VTFTRLAGLLGFLGVALGAFGAHGLRARFVGGGGEIWRTAVLYHLLHAVALLGVSLAAERVRARVAISWLFVAGIVLFSGSLYVLALTGFSWLGPITPLGGAAFLSAWLVLALANR